MMKFDALLRREGTIHLMTSDEEGMGGLTSRGGGVTTLLAPVLTLVQWWLKEMQDLVPQTLRRRFSERRVLVRASHRELCVADPESRVNGECYSINKHDEPEGGASRAHPLQRCDVVLDHSLVLVHEIELPIDAEANLRRVLSFSMDRYTPFNEKDVLFDYKILHRDSVNRKMAVVLYVAPRESIAPIMHRLAGMGLVPACLDIESDEASGRADINLLAPDKRIAPSGMGRGGRVLALSALLLFLVTLAMPFVMRQQAVSRLEGEFAQLSEQARKAETDHMELLDRVQRMRMIQARTSAAPATLDVLLELTRLMPDDAWAGQVAIKAGRVRLNGEATAASELLTRLSNSAIFSDPKFEAPLTQNPRTGRERFVISLAIRSPGDGH